MSLRNLFAFLVVLGLVFSAPSVPIGACQNITAPGAYYMLTRDISGDYGTENYCIGIYAENVTLDCAGHSISGATSNDVEISHTNNVTLKNCNIYGGVWGLYADGYNHTIVNNTFHDQSENIDVAISGSYFANNTFFASENECALNSGDDNVFEGNEFYDCGYSGLSLIGDRNTVRNNTAHDCDESGFYVHGMLNNITGNTAYGDDLVDYTGGGFEIAGASMDIISGNTAYGSANGFYIEGNIPRDILGAGVPTVFGNTFTNNHAYNNIVGLNTLDYNGTYKNNVLEQNQEADLLLGGDAWFSIGSGLHGGDMRATTPLQTLPKMCYNLFENNTGSEGRPIYFANKTVTLSGGTYSEVVLCNADNSVVEGVTVSGSDDLDNNGMLLFYTDDATLKNSASNDNLFGFALFGSNGTALEGCNSDGSGVGIATGRCKDILVTNHESKNNRMNGTLFINLLMNYLGGPLTGEPLAAPLRIKDSGAGAIFIQSPRTTVSSSSFSESTAGVMFAFSDESLMQGVSIFNNDIFGAGYLNSYDGALSGSNIYGNDGDMYSIFYEGTGLPPRYQMLEKLPLGAGVLDLSSGVLTSLEGTLRYTGPCWSSSQNCDPARGSICSYDTGGCVDGAVENHYNSSRIYENNYGLVLLNIGNEFVDGCSVYGNSVLGVIDASNVRNALAGDLQSSQIPVEQPKSATIIHTTMSKNGEGLFSTFAAVIEKSNGGRQTQFEKLLLLLDKSIPKGTFEFELVEANPFWNMDLPLAFRADPSAQGIPWEVNNSAVGAGTSSVSFSVEDNATAVYVISDTNLPSVRKIVVQEEDLDLNATLHLLPSVGVAGKEPFLDKYFLVAALAENPNYLSATPEGPEITNFQVHYGGTANYDGNTMGLYLLSYYRQGWYCEEDTDCPNYPHQRCYEKMCTNVQCESDSDCNSLQAAPTGQYCVGYICSGCRNDTDCETGYSCYELAQSNGECRPTLCVYDSECPEGYVCNMERAACERSIIGGERSSGPLPLPQEQPKDVLKASETPQGDVFLKGRWIPVPLQSNNVSGRTITVTPLSQHDRTEFLSQIFGDVIPSGYLVYADVYGLFATPLPGKEGAEPLVYACQQDADCGDCEYCSIANHQCMPKEAAQCGVVGKQCGAGYACDQCSCVPPECTSDSQCKEGYQCMDYSCVEKPTEKPPEQKPPEQPSPAPVAPTPVVTPEQPPEKPTYPLVTVEVPSVNAPKQPVTQPQAEFQVQQIGVVLLLLIGLVAAYLWFSRRHQPSATHRE